MSTTIDGLQTEARNAKSADLDTISTLELCQIINDEDATIASVVKGCIPTISDAIDALTPRIRQGGRLIYVGAGTSGRLGVLDASEIPPTYSAPPAQFVGLIAGGDVALRSSIEGAEDSVEGAVDDLEALDLDEDIDSLIALAASGRTPYATSSLAFAKSKGCVTIGVACSAPSVMSKSGNVDFMINAVTGPEVVTGSTRMKAGTVQKLILNMLSTGIMIRIGKTFGNIMIDVKPTNAKLQMRARRILREICGDRCPDDDEELDHIIHACEGSVKLATVTIYFSVSIEEAKRRLEEAKGVLASLLKESQSTAVGQIGELEDRQYVLCVDGGGSKCKAVILASDGSTGIGEAGPCNPSENGVEAAVAAICLAIQRSVESCPSANGKSIREISLVEAWIGLAGADRKPIENQVRLEMTKLLGDRFGKSLSVTNDIELLASAAGHRLGIKYLVVLIAGTGSVAMRFQRDGSSFRRVGRSGGWGALLGDDGSGFDLGRAAIRIALLELQDQLLQSVLPGEALESPDPLPGLILDYFRPSGNGEGGYDLLSSVLLSESQDTQTTSQTKRRIAGCARGVVDAMERSGKARQIVLDTVNKLVSLLWPLMHSKRLDADCPTLILAGGMMNSKALRKILVDMLVKTGTHLGNVEFNGDPASTGAQFLAKQVWGSPVKD